MEIVYVVFASILVWTSYKSFSKGLDYLAFFKEELSKKDACFSPMASVIVPCRGLDQGLEENLRMLFRQDYPQYEILFVVDSEDDEAAAVIKKLITENKNVKSSLLVAGKARNEGQKIHNLRYALDFTSAESAVFVFADSDARMNEDWLKSLVEPLKDETIGATTGYRWMISKKRNLASELRSVWNASVASALGRNTESNFCWGGSMALRKETFEKCKVREKWRGKLSDDFVVTNAIKEAGLKVFFVPKAMTATLEDVSFRQMLEFTNRQMKITRAYAPHLWINCLLGSFLFNLVFLWSFLIAFLDAFRSPVSWIATGSVFSVSLFSIGKSLLRLKAVSLVLKNYDLKYQYLTHSTLWLISPSVYLYNCVCAMFLKKIVWRGISYDIEKIN
ncbi:MAG: glycosyltransferase [Acidobacteria bacterium]|jgi:cellulose synthase/poly-beta-1,6-N-acetylglucosamine synthase-like glycosyltransferase|nr:MAG: glycosyltransferase [Acidobacteriota bacterium]GIU83040.1 MAG: ceramide glucosyltransferase [Pyrinomonadaceae bacterium]